MNAQSPLKHSISQSHWTRLLWLAWFVIAFALGAYGYWRYESDHLGDASILGSLYHSTQLFFLHMPYLEKTINGWLEAGRWMAALWFAYTALTLAFALFADELQWFRHRRLRGHSVVCGLGQAGLALVQSLRSGSEADSSCSILAVDAAPSEESVRIVEALRVCVIRGDATRAEVLAEARVGHAARLFALCPEDATNVQVAMRSQELAKAAARSVQEPLLCHVQMTDVDLRVACQRTQRLAPSESGCHIRFIDVFDTAARRLLLREMPLDRATGVRVDDPRTVQLVIIGFGRMGRSLAVRAAKLGHFANGNRLGIAVLDHHASANEQRLLFRFPAFPAVCDLGFHGLEAESLAARQLIEQRCDPEKFIANVALCLEHEVRATEIALQLIPVLRDRNVPLAVRYACEGGLESLLRADQEAGGKRLVHPFGLMSRAMFRDILDDELKQWLAKAIHEQFREARLAEGRSLQESALWPWERLDENFRESSRQQADHIPIKLRAVGRVSVATGDPRPVAAFNQEEVELLARMEHARWNAERLLDGWRFAPGKEDERRKTSPYILPWEQLPYEVQEYDRAAVREIPVLLERAGMKIVQFAQ